MKILVDIVHMADVNFFRNPVKIFRSQGHEVVISVMGRGDLPSIAKKEFGEVSVIGKHRKGSIFIKASSNLARIVKLRLFIEKIKPDVVTSFSYYPAASAFGKGIKSVVFHDDAEYKEQFALCKLFAGRLVIPDFIKYSGRNIKKYHSYKEWAYLNPNYFRPKESVLKKHGLEKNQYIFIREIEPISLNYPENKPIDWHKIFPIIRKKGLKIVVSLENKLRKNDFKNCLLLQESAQEFYSIVYYALALISSGDTMARESALIGVPSFYTGSRRMVINQELIDKKLLVQIESLAQLQNIIEGLTIKDRKEASNKAKTYSKELEDTTQVIIRELLS